MVKPTWRERERERVTAAHEKGKEDPDGRAAIGEVVFGRVVKHARICHVLAAAYARLFVRSANGLIS